MGHQVIKQPDGRYAIFSSVVDSWIVYDATRQDVIGYYVEMAAKDARRNAERILDCVDDDPRKAYYQFTMTFAEANARSKASGGEVLDGPVDEKVLAELTANEVVRLFGKLDHWLIVGERLPHEWAHPEPGVIAE